MAITATLGTALSNTTNPDPGTLGTKVPYANALANNGAQGVPPYTASAAWVSQGNKALFPLGAKDGASYLPIKLDFVTSSAGATCTATFWSFNPVSVSWSKMSTASITGNTTYLLAPQGNDAIFIQLSTPSAETISIYFDPGNAQAR